MKKKKVLFHQNLNDNLINLKRKFVEEEKEGEKAEKSPDIVFDQNESLKKLIINFIDKLKDQKKETSYQSNLNNENQVYLDIVKCNRFIENHLEEINSGSIELNVYKQKCLYFESIYFFIK